MLSAPSAALSDPMTGYLENPPLWPSAHRDLAHPGRPNAVGVHWDHGVLHVKVTDAEAKAHVDARAEALGLSFTWY